MRTIKEAATDFLGKKRIAVTGVSRNPGAHASNAVYRRLRERGYEVFAVNPNADEVEGDICYHDLHSISGGVDAVVIGTRPERALDTMSEVDQLGIQHVWMHRSFGTGSVSMWRRTSAEQMESTSSTGVAPACSSPPPTRVTRRCASFSPSTDTSPGRWDDHDYSDCQGTMAQPPVVLRGRLSLVQSAYSIARRRAPQ